MNTYVVKLTSGGWASGRAGDEVAGHEAFARTWTDKRAAAAVARLRGGSVEVAAENAAAPERGNRLRLCEPNHRVLVARRGKVDVVTGELTAKSRSSASKKKHKAVEFRKEHHAARWGSTCAVVARRVVRWSRRKKKFVARTRVAVVMIKQLSWLYDVGDVVMTRHAKSRRYTEWTIASKHPTTRRGLGEAMAGAKVDGSKRKVPIMVVVDHLHVAE